MDGRIGALHVRYRIPPASAHAAALAPGLDRAIRARLGEAVGARLAQVFGPDPSVIVIRELKTRVALDARERLDGPVLERISRASVDAVTDMLRESDTPDAVMRFADEAEFAGSFLLDLLQGTAWDRWYFGAFQPFRRADVRETIIAILADRQTECARILAWLARRGRLHDVVAAIGSSDARRLASGRMTDAALAAQPDIEPLLEAAFILVERLGWPATDRTDRRSVLASFLSSAALPPSWSDRRALSAWVLECVRAIVAAFARAGKRQEQRHTVAATQELLPQSLDWLDTAWLSEELQRLSGDDGVIESPPAARPRLLAANHERMLARLARRIVEGRVRVDRASDRDMLIVRLVAAVSEEGDQSAPLDRAVIAAIERVAYAWQSARAAGYDAAMLVRMLRAPHEAAAATAPPIAREVASRVEAVAAAGSAAVDVFRAVAGATIAADETGDRTEFAGLYLLTRGILDVRLSMLARDAGVPWDLLRLALATQWLGVCAPFDRPTSLWLGTPGEELAVLSECAANLADLERSLVATLLDQRAIEAPPPGSESEPAAIVARVAQMVMRAWARWLPGLAQASPAFLVANALTRGGRVRVSESRVAVTLEPAALDVVLEMAGYFKPIESVAWLGGRTVTFAVQRAIGS